MKVIRLGQTLVNGGAFPPPPPTANALLFLKRNTHMYSGFDSLCATVTPPTSSDASTIVADSPLTKWEDYNGSGIYAEQAVCLDCPEYLFGYGYARFDGTQFFDMNTPVSLTGEFTIYVKATFQTTNTKALIGGDTINFWRITNNKSFRLRIDGTPNNDFTEVTDTILTGDQTDPMYICVLSRDASGYLSMFVHGGVKPGYNDKAWGSTTNQDTDTMTISNVGAKEDDVQNFHGWMSDVLIYDTHHDASERAIIYNYL